MTRLKSLILILTGILLFSCSPDNQEGEGGADTFTVRLDVPAGDFGGNIKTRWKAGDEISINGYAYKAQKDGVEAVFSPVSTPAPKAGQYVAVYPSSFKVEGTTVSGTLPGSVTQSNNTSTYPPLVQVAKSSNRTLQLKNVLSYVSVGIKAEGVKGFKFESAGEEVLCGKFSVDCSSTDYQLSVQEGEKAVSVNAAASSFVMNSTVLVATLPRTLKSGFGVTMTFDDAHSAISWSSSTGEHTVLYRAGLLQLGDFAYDFSTAMGTLGRLASGLKAIIDCNSPLSSPVSRMLFSSFSEVHGGDIVPGICEQYVVNPSFEVWDATGDLGESKTELIYTGGSAIAEDEAVAYPWEKRLSGSGASVGKTTSEKYNTDYSQCLTVSTGGTATLLQRLALPFYRVSKYKLSFYAKSSGSEVSLKASFHDTQNNENKVLSPEYSPALTSGWQRYETELTLTSSSHMHNGRYQQYNVWFDVSGSGQVWIDQVNVIPSDCIEGIFNPETVEYFRQYKVQGIRWPGGNFTSGYNWKDGIGERDLRPSRKNPAWGGINSNFCGTDEFMRFCALTGIEPIMGVGYNTSVMPEGDVADWVEYCNGPASTTFGALRAANGHPEPYNIKYWGIGNEVYGTYQLGHVSAASYAIGLSNMVDRMKAVDPGIVILASGQGVHNAYRGAYEGWTETVYSTAGSKIDLFDCHMYVYGNSTSNNLNLGGEAWFRIFAAANFHLRDYIRNFRKIAPGKKMAMLEWGVLPQIAGTNLTPQRQTFANLLLSAIEWNEMIRNSDVMEMAAFHNFSFYISPQNLHSEPVNHRTNLYKELSPMAGGYCVPVNIPVVPTYDQNTNVLDIGVRKAVPEIDAAAVKKGNVLYLSLVNRSPSEKFELGLALSGASVTEISGTTYTSDLPYAKNLWSSVNNCNKATAKVSGSIVTLPPLSFTILEISLK
ncbi:MAG: carbohydrate binding domain-containing protein [Bacteroidales bacterium]|nr:carbohydrate binding domain-containing protein [Bacteroidales bacterium]